MLSIVSFCIIIAFSSFAQGVIGFGATLFATPIALLFLDKETVVSSMLIVSISINLLLSRHIKEPVNTTVIGPLFLSSLLGMPIGLIILQSVSVELMRIIIGSLSIIFIILLTFKKLSLPSSKWLTWLAGFLSGVLTTSTSMNGPPIVLLLASQKVTRDHFRKTLVTFFLLMSLVALGLFLFHGVLTIHRLIFGLLAIPFALSGSYLGNHVSQKVPHRLFRALTLTSVFISAAYGICAGLGIEN